MDKDNVKKWLAREGKTREWLAEQCDVSVRTVNNWLGSERPIPAKAVLVIERLMNFQQTPHPSAENNIVLSFSRADWDAICATAMKEGKLPNQWAEEALRGLADEDVETLAEELRPYVESQKEAKNNPNNL